MRFRLRLKIFFILMATSLSIISVMLGFVLFFFEIGFSGYVEEVELKRIENLSRQLGNLYAMNQDFGFLNADPQLALELEDRLFQEPEWPHPGDPDRFHPEPHFQGEEHFPLFFVLDKEKQPVFGADGSHDTARLLPVRAGGDLVGWVGVHGPEILDEANEGFIRDLSAQFLAIAGIVTLFSAIAAMLGADIFQRPIQTLVRGTRALSSGDYSVRVPETATDELGDLSRDFNNLARTLEENEAARKKWVEDISHELKTPLTLMGGELEAVRDGVRQVTPETLDLLSTDIRRLTNLVNDLNELWKSESEKQPRAHTRVNLPEILVRSGEKAAARFHDKAITLSLPAPDSPVWIKGDRERLSQVFDNLFHNALRYTDPGGQVRVTATVDAAFANIKFEDSPPGVPEQDLENIFKRLYRVEPSRNRALGGAGIGLAICKNIILAHQGRIRAFPSPLGGLGIGIRLPCYRKEKK